MHSFDPLAPGGRSSASTAVSSSSAPAPAATLAPAPSRASSAQSTEHLRPWEVRWEEFDFVKQIGGGSFGKASFLFLCKERRWWPDSRLSHELAAGGSCQRQLVLLLSLPDFEYPRPMPHVQVYLATWNSTPVAVQVLDGNHGDVLATLGNPILDKLRAVSERDCVCTCGFSTVHSKLEGGAAGGRAAQGVWGRCSETGF